MLHEFITSYRDPIIARTRAKLTDRPWALVSESELEHGVPLFLTQLSETLRLENTTKAFTDSEIVASAARHGRELRALGFNISQVVHDYGDICQAITEVAVDHQVPITTEEFHTLNRCLDAAIAGAVTEHARITAETRNTEEIERTGQLAHEIRDVLHSAVLAFNTLKLGTVAINGSTGAVLGRSLMTLRDLVDNTLSDVRMAANIQRRERIPVAAFLGEIAAVANLQSECRGLRFRVENVAADMIVDGDRQLLSSAVMNLLNNAFKFTHAGGLVVLRACRNGPRDCRVEAAVQRMEFFGRDRHLVIHGHFGNRLADVPVVVPEAKLLKWKVPVPGLGHSSPVVWGDHVCTASAISGTPDPQLKVGLYGDIGSVLDQTEHKFIVSCFDKRTGKPRWERVAKSGVPIVKRHPKSTHASSTLATDGQHIIAMFGSEGLYAYNLNGDLVWKKDFGTLDSGFFMVPDAQWGFGSSPVIHHGRLILQVDVQKDSFVAAFDVRTGKELWRTPRADVPTWSTPAVVSMNGRDQVIVNGWKHIGGYDLETGKEVWRMTGGGDIPVPTPIAAHGLVFITNAHGKMAPIYAVKPTATGDITLKDGETANAHIAWSYLRDGGYMQTPIVYGDILYVCRDNGVLSAFDAKTGTRHYQARLGDGKTGFSASAVASAGRIYFTSEDGDVYVVKAGPAYELLATNPLGEVAMATPAISEGTLLFRTRNHLVAVGER